MKNPAELSRGQLVEIVTGLVRALYGRCHEDGSWAYAADKEWSGGDVCEAAAGLLSRHGLVPVAEGAGHGTQPQLPPEPQQDVYRLRIDGPSFRQQRQLALRLRQQIADPQDQALWDGLIALTDEIADQAHDRHGLDCLLDTEDRGCACEQPGYFCSGIPGILAHLEHGRLAAGAKVQRCDLCQRYPSDHAALERLRELGHLYNAADYPESLRGMFSVEADFPSVEPPPYLAQLNPQLYEEECRRVQSRFDEAVRLAEEAFTAELAALVSHLTERLSGSEDGKPRIFRDSAVENLTEFFSRFRELNIRSSEQLDGLVAQAQRVIRGVEPQDLRDNAGLRQHVATEMSRVQSVLDGLLVDRPRRNILRRPR
jgi:hypothetical protein